jgi:hypothetical protein
MQQSLTAYKLIENLPKTSFIAKDRVLSINFIDSGNQFAQLICEREKIPVKSKNQNDERNTGGGFEIPRLLSTRRVTTLPLGQRWNSQNQISGHVIVIPPR